MSERVLGLENFQFGNNLVWHLFVNDIEVDNQVSCTVTFDPKKESEQIEPALNYYQYHLKGISLLPRHDYGFLSTNFYEIIDEKEYNKQVKKLGKLSFGVIKNEEWI